MPSSAAQPPRSPRRHVSSPRRFAPPSRRPPSSWPSKMSGRRPRRSSLGPVLCPPSARPSNWSGGRPVSRRPVSTTGAFRGVRTDTRPVSAAAASALSAPRWILECVGAAGQPTFGTAGSTCCCGLRAAWSSLPESGLAGRDGRASPVHGWHECLRQTWAAAASHAQRLGRRARRLADQGSWSSARCRSVGRGSTRRSRCSHVPRRCVLGRLPA
jgi:hypothetical protein